MQPSIRKFLFKLSYTVLPLWLLFIGITVYYTLGVRPNIRGDLGVLGKIDFGSYYQEPYDSTLTEQLFTDIRHQSQLSHQKADVLVCGDSYSQQGVMGFQSYIARHGLRVFNFAPPRVVYLNSVQTVYELLDKGYVDSTNIKTLVMESVERGLLIRLIEFNPSADQLSTIPLPTTAPSAPAQAPSAWSLWEAKQYLLLRIGIRLPVKQALLDGDYFTGGKPDHLFFYKDDVADVTLHIDTMYHARAKEVYGMLQRKAAEKGVRLLWVICPDKFDIYQDHVVDNRWGHKTVNEDLRDIFGPDSNLIIAKEYLMPHINTAEKDIYKLNDSHWSYKAAAIVGDSIAATLQRR